MDNINTDETKRMVQESAEKLRAYLANPNLSPEEIALLMKFSVNLDLYQTAWLNCIIQEATGAEEKATSIRNYATLFQIELEGAMDRLSLLSIK